MEQAKALSALEPFLALTSSATSPRAAADLVVRATSAPNTYIFTELLQTPQIQALASSAEFAHYLTALHIFSYGTYESYQFTEGLPGLTDAQRLKLRQLSLLTIASQKNDPSFAGAEPALSYASLQKALDLPSRQAVEELVISAIYAGLIKAQLNPKASLVQINSVSSLRDVAPNAIDGLLSSLQAWSDRCDATLNSLSTQMAQLRADADRRAAQSAAWAEKSEKLLEEEKRGGIGAPLNSSGSILTDIGGSSGIGGVPTTFGSSGSTGAPFPGPSGSDSALPASFVNATQAVKRDSTQMDAADDDEHDNKITKYDNNTTALSQQTNQMGLSDAGYEVGS
ncbi:hypothetical protein QBC43DRAFT_347004 [Cladorrhinum sp. PSN259]|nr:hypothetical protein QBC43DRAFT_347004 [Cladorrhinum sp. PSN259]